MADYTYLVDDIIQAAENEGTEFVNYVPKMVNRAEERLTRDLDDYGLVTYTSVAIPSGNNQVTLPSGTRILKNFNIVANSTRINLLPRTDEYIRDYWPVSASTGTPRYYSRRTNSSIKIVPTPVSATTVEIQTASQPLALASATGTSVTTSNYFSEYCYDALFAGCMMEATLFMKDWNTLPVWQQQYQMAIDQLRNQARRTRQDDMAVAGSPAGGPNTIIQGAS